MVLQSVLLSSVVGTSLTYEECPGSEALESGNNFKLSQNQEIQESIDSWKLCNTTTLIDLLFILYFLKYFFCSGLAANKEASSWCGQRKPCLCVCFWK